MITVDGEATQTAWAENAPEAAEILRDLVRTTQHDLRMLINQVIGYADLLQEEAAELGRDDSLAGLEQIRTAGRALLAWLTATLDLPRLVAGKLNAARAVSEARPLLTTIVGWCAVLNSQAASAGWTDASADVARIEAGCRTLLGSLVRITDLSRFRLGGAAVDSLPTERALALQAMARARAVVQTGAADDGKPPKLLVVEADEAQRELLSRRLERLGYVVSVVCDGFEALKTLRAEEYDLVLLDVMLPEMDGAAVLEELKRDPALREMPVIMLSALDQIEWVTQCIELGAEDYLPIPFEPMVLQARIEACLEKRRLRRKEIEYLRDVAQVTEAAMTMEVASASFQPQVLDGVARRDDGLGHLARVFQRMALEVKMREEQLRREVQELRIEIDTVKRNLEVSKITGSDYFQQIREQAKSLRSSR